MKLPFLRPGRRRTRDDVLHMLKEAQDAGLFSDEAYTLVKGVLKADTRTVEEIMVPRVDMVAVREQDTLEEVLKIYHKAGFSKMPVLGSSRETVVGILYMKELLKHVEHLQEKRARDIAVTPYYIPETKPVLDTLRDLQRRHLSIAVVVDEFGSVVGMVTMEDLLEEIVGEIWEEFDREQPLMVPLGDGVYEVSAVMNLEDFAEATGLDIHDDEVNTIGGYVLARVDHLPRTGERFRVGPLQVEVLEATRQRLKRLKIQILPEHSDENSQEH